MARPTAQAKKKKVVKPEPEKPAEEVVENQELVQAAEATVQENAAVLPPESIPLPPETGPFSNLGEEVQMDLEPGDTESNDIDEATENVMLTEDDEDKMKEEEEEVVGEGEGEGEGEDGMKAEQADGDGYEESESNESNQTKRKIEETVVKKTKKPKIEKTVKVNVYVPSISEDHLEGPMEALFTSSGIEVKDIKKTEDKTWVLYGEVELMKAADKEKVLALTGREVVEGREVKVELVPGDDQDTKIDAPDECILFVRNIDKLTTEENLRELFPDVKSLKLPEKDDKNRGFAFLEFETKEIVEELKKKKVPTATLR